MNRFAGLSLGIGLVLVTAFQVSEVRARTLYWQSLEVEARIDSEGLMHVRERHAMVFSGAWNGGERSFKVQSGQKLDLVEISRVDPQTGLRWPLRRGSLEVVDNYAWHDRETLRWRSRLPTDPEFDDTEIVYEIDYVMSGVLLRKGKSYRLDHDFVFPDRVGSIESFRLDLEFDPVWEVPSGLARQLERGPLLPGAGLVVSADLWHRGLDSPGATLSFMSDFARLLPLGLALLVAAAGAWSFFRHERGQGRFLPTDAPDGIDLRWFEEHVFSLRPEVAGALWDGSVGPHEVSALISRWIQEGRVASRVRETGSVFKSQVLELDLIADRGTFNGYERRLLEKLFFDNRTTTDTDAVRKRYSSTGFSPTSTIRAPIERRLRALPGMGRSIGGPDRTPGCLLGLAFVALMGLEYWQGQDSALVLVATLVLVAIVPTAAAYSLAYRYRRKADGLVGAGLWFAFPLALLFLLLTGTVLLPGRAATFNAMRLGWFGLSAAALFFLVVTNGVLNVARTRESKARVARRKQLARARRLLAEELGKEAPALDDGWLPYLLAFGLDNRVDRWSRSFGGASARHISTTATSSGSSGSSWTGGGGAFGGAGSTAAWTAAAGGIAAGVSKPSSGSGGGNSGGGGGSSGGGGGGGW